MSVVIYTEVFLGKWSHFKKLSKNLIGGAEVYLYELAVGPLSHLYEHITVKQLSGDSGELNDAIEIQTVDSYPQQLSSDASLLITNNGFSYPRTSKALIKSRLSNKKVKIINLHHGSIVKPTLFKPANFRYFASVYLFYNPGLIGRLKLALEFILWELRRVSIMARMNFLTLFVDRVVSVDEFSLRYLFPSLRNKWKVILNSADLNLFPPLEKVSNERPIILVPRNLRYERGIPLIPFIASYVKSEIGDNFEFWITGTGAMEEYVIQKSKELSVEANVKLIGHQDHFKDMPRLYKQSDIILVPTFTDEGTSLSIIEAMASNRPVVTTDVGGINDIGAHKEHKLSSPFSARQIAENIIMLMQDELLVEQLTERALKLVKEKHELAKWQKQWEKVLKETV